MFRAEVHEVKVRQGRAASQRGCRRRRAQVRHASCM